MFNPIYSFVVNELDETSTIGYHSRSESGRRTAFGVGYFSGHCDQFASYNVRLHDSEPVQYSDRTNYILSVRFP